LLILKEQDIVQKNVILDIRMELRNSINNSMLLLEHNKV